MQEASSRGDTAVSMPSLQQPLGGSGHCSDRDSVPSRESSPVPAAPTSPSPSPLTPTDTQTQAQLEADKRAVYKHPLSDIQAFVQHQEQDRKPFFSDDPEVDGLMVKAIQVLRIHLLELEKVQELCKDFCNRYIACLKSKMQSENLLRSADFPGSGSHCEGGSMSDTASSSSCSSPPTTGVQKPISPSCPLSCHCHSGQLPLTTAGFVAQPIQIQTSATLPVIASIHGGTPLSQIGANLSSSNQDHRVSNLGPRALSLSGDDEDEDILGSKKKQKRGVLPKQATSIMRSWLFQHIVHPYPTEDEKRQIAAQTNLTLLQVNNWFINARRRILQPMLDASNPENSQQKAKKAKVQTVRPVERFWPDAIAALQPRPSSHNGMASVSSPSAHGKPSTSGTSLCSEASDDSACGGDTGHSAAEDESRDHGTGGGSSGKA
ncbi:hypothetical protein MTO96_004638 [Rhipicephalus appendiculatus]